MNVVCITKDGVVHKRVNGKHEPPIVVPAHIHEKAVRKINAIKEARYREQKNKETAANR
ncbi:hypothetical protein JTF06_11925 [Desemzia sp. RIT804]|uniref:hypothetical protein n=1 Tax=Desemzia sp. RIT 804 TaxID=2810209 RepID=UPI0019516E23|nr:hypothetical protein [Desemzia sp. RIT 804]MBM6615593.1 hypothetical protein [Desemzia sp. RIT 804]